MHPHTYCIVSCVVVPVFFNHEGGYGLNVLYGFVCTLQLTRALAPLLGGWLSHIFGLPAPFYARACVGAVGCMVVSAAMAGTELHIMRCGDHLHSWRNAAE